MVRLFAFPLLPPLFVLVYGVTFLSAAPGAPSAYIPYALVTGPVGLAGFFLIGLKTNLIWVILAGTYALYFVYGLILSSRDARGGNIGSALMVIGVLHALSGMAFMYLSTSTS